MIINIRKKQIRKLFNDFIDIMGFYDIWFSGIKGYGKYKEWHYNGQLEILCYYNKNGKKIGMYKKWWENGQLWKEINYNKKGKLDGICKNWHINGNLIFEIKFKNNKLIAINYINLKYINDEYWFEYYDQIQDDYINFYDKIKEMYNDKYKKRTN